VSVAVETQMRQIIGFMFLVISGLAFFLGSYATYFSITSEFYPPLLLAGIIGLLASWLIFRTSLRLLKTISSNDIPAYVPRFSAKDFDDDKAAKLTKEEFEFLDRQLWGVMSTHLVKYGSRPNVVSQKTVFAYIYGFIDGYLAQHSPCPRADQIKILNSIIYKYIYNLKEKKVDVDTDPKFIQKCFSNLDKEFVIGLMLGGREGIIFSEDNSYLPVGLLQSAIELDDADLDKVMFRAGKSLRGVIDASKFELKKAKKKLNAGTKECPYCLERVKAGAVKCRFCHESLA
jgi:hypothetical protein